MRNAVDACCSQCGDAFDWLSGTALRCPNGHDINVQPITLGQYQGGKVERLNISKDKLVVSTDCLAIEELSPAYD